MRKYLFLVLLLCSFGRSFSQKFEEKLLDAFFENLVRKDSVLSIKRNLGDIQILVDPVTGNETITYPKILGHYDSIFIKDYSEEAKSKIINSWWPIPVFKDTICLIDTTSILDTKFEKKEGGHYFRLLSYNKYLRSVRRYNQYERASKSFDTLNTSYFYLQDMGIRGNALYLDVSIEGNHELLLMDFDISDGVKFLGHYAFHPRYELIDDW